MILNHLIKYSIICILLKQMKSSGLPNCGGANGSICCAGYFWNNLLKNCIPCDIGFHGPNCSRPCPYPAFGKDCQFICNCKVHYCHRQHGCGECEKVCEAGLYGCNCENPCLYPTYGEECQKNCECEQQLCNATTGCKDNNGTILASTSTVINIQVNEHTVAFEPSTLRSTAGSNVPNRNASCENENQDTKRGKQSRRANIDGLTAGIICLAVIAGLLILFNVGTYLLTMKPRSRTILQIE
ncbi:cell death abnormality protein 1-like isoform X1 [Ostrea edulis]|uniref:cell death abnormality protein 1-like isoform X1 n=2 Tax=Ostrea edulis TaxID=37623 RepID=UPI0024AF28AA|nr:cell death abnormality protein 1-like isoform X1 [Ostrea edulis]